MYLDMRTLRDWLSGHFWEKQESSACGVGTSVLRGTQLAIWDMPVSLAPCSELPAGCPLFPREDSWVNAANIQRASWGRETWYTGWEPVPHTAKVGSIPGASQCPSKPYSEWSLSSQPWGSPEHCRAWLPKTKLTNKNIGWAKTTLPYSCFSLPHSRHKLDAQMNLGNAVKDAPLKPQNTDDST